MTDHSLEAPRRARDPALEVFVETAPEHQLREIYGSNQSVYSRFVNICARDIHPSECWAD